MNGARLNPPSEQRELPFQRRCNHLALEKFGLVVADNISLLLDTDIHLGGGGGGGEGGGGEEGAGPGFLLSPQKDNMVQSYLP